MSASYGEVSLSIPASFHDASTKEPSLDNEAARSRRLWVETELAYCLFSSRTLPHANLDHTTLAVAGRLHRQNNYAHAGHLHPFAQPQTTGLIGATERVGRRTVVERAFPVSAIPVQ